MKPGGVGGPGADALRAQHQTLVERADTEAAAYRKAAERRIDRELGIEGKTFGNVPQQTQELYQRMRTEHNEELRRLDTALKQTRALLAPLDGLIRWLNYLTPLAEANTKIDYEIYNRKCVLQSVGSVRKMVDAAGPELAKQFPVAQLALVEKSLQDEITELEKRAPPKAPPPPVQSYGGGYGGYGAAQQIPKDPVILDTKKVGDLAAGAKIIAEKLGMPALEAEIKAAGAKLGGVEAENFASAIRGYAVLTDYALGTLDYRRVLGPLTFSPPNDRTDHRTRNYPQHMVGASQDRQAESKRLLGEAIATAVRGKDPAEAAQAALTQHLTRELGLKPGEIAGWKLEMKNLLQVLDQEAFVPLRALIEGIPNPNSGRYQAMHIEGMRVEVRKLAQAMLEGRYPESRLDDPRNQAQLAVLPTEPQRETWIAQFKTEGTGSKGQKMTTHESDGFENLWATKIGGPSHGFDNMPHCTLSIVGNVRTKAIVVDDANWHQPVARAYIRLLGNDRGRPMLYVEDTQIDFKVRSSPNFDEAGIKERVVAHAVKRARELGADLVVSDLLCKTLDRMGERYTRYDGLLVLEPSAVVSEASDSMLGHDMAQTERHRARSCFPFVEIKL